MLRIVSLKGQKGRLPPVNCRRRGDNHGRRRRNHQCGIDDHRSGRHNRRCRGHNNGRRAYDVAHDRRRSNCRRRDPPTAVMTMMVSMEVMPWRMMVITESPVMSPMMSARPWTSEYEASHGNGHKHYCQFLVHVFLLFLSLLTMY